MNTHQPAATVVEYVEFSCIEGVTEADVMAALKSTDALLADIDGFVHRYIAKRFDNWVEVVFWRNQAAADAGLETFTQDTRSKALFDLIEEGSVSIRYAQLQPV